MAFTLKAKSLVTNPNELTRAEGALDVADNVVIDRDDIIEPRRGFEHYSKGLGSLSDNPKQLLTYKDKIIAHYTNKIAFDSGNGVFNDFSGEFSELKDNIRIKGIEYGGNYYFTSENGIKKISAASANDFTTDAGFITNAGGVKAIDLSATVLFSDSGFLPPESKVAYRVLWGIKDANNRLVLGSPSARFVLTNPKKSSTTSEKFSISIDDFSLLNTSAVDYILFNSSNLQYFMWFNTQADDSGSKPTFDGSIQSEDLKDNYVKIEALEISSSNIEIQLDTYGTTGSPTGDTLNDILSEYNRTVPQSKKVTLVSGLGDFVPNSGITITLVDGSDPIIGDTVPQTAETIGRVPVEIDLSQETALTNTKVAEIIGNTIDGLLSFDVSVAGNKVTMTSTEEGEEIDNASLGALFSEGAAALTIEEKGGVIEGQSANAKLNITIPEEVNTNYFIQVYRTRVATAVAGLDLNDIDPGEEFNLVYEEGVSEGQTEFIIEDIQSESFRDSGAPLYTNPLTGEGIINSNDRPPIATDIARFQNSVFYANTKRPHTATTTLTGVSTEPDSNGAFFISGESTLTIGNEDVAREYLFKGDTQSQNIEVIPEGSIKQTTRLTVNSTSDYLSGSYFVLNDNAGTVAFWLGFEYEEDFNTFVADRNIKVEIQPNMSPSEVAKVLYDTISSDSEFNGVFNYEDGTIEVQSISYGKKEESAGKYSNVRYFDREGIEIYTYPSTGTITHLSQTNSGRFVFRSDDGLYYLDDLSTSPIQTKSDDDIIYDVSAIPPIYQPLIPRRDFHVGKFSNNLYIQGFVINSGVVEGFLKTYRSSDNGVTIQEIHSSSPYPYNQSVDLDFDFGKSGFYESPVNGDLYAFGLNRINETTYSELYKSTDYGDTFSTILSIPYAGTGVTTGEYIEKLFINSLGVILILIKEANNSIRRIEYSSDDGNSFSQSTGTISFSTNIFLDGPVGTYGGFLEDNSGHIYLGNNYSIDNGVSFQTALVSDPLIHITEDNRLITNNVNQNPNIYPDVVYNIYSSNDYFSGSGAPLSLKLYDFPEYPFHNYDKALYYAREDRIYKLSLLDYNSSSPIDSAYTMFYSGNAGLSYLSEDSNHFKYFLNSPSTINDSTSSEKYFYFADDLGIYKTSNITSSSVNFQPLANCKNIFINNTRDKLYAISPTGLHISSSSTEDFSSFTTYTNFGISLTDLFDIYVDQNERIYVTSLNNGLFISDDGGLNFTNINTSNSTIPSNNLGYINGIGNSIYLSSNSGLFNGYIASNNGGATFTSIDDTDGMLSGPVTNIEISTNGDLYLCTSNGISVTSDNSIFKNYDINVDFDFGGRPLSNINLSRDNIYAYSFGTSSIFKLNKITDQFELLTLYVPTNAKTNPNSFGVSLNDKILYTSDSGGSSINYYISLDNEILFHVDIETVLTSLTPPAYFDYYKASLYMSTDAGKSFTFVETFNDTDNPDYILGNQEYASGVDFKFADNQAFFLVNYSFHKINFDFANFPTDPSYRQRVLTSELGASTLKFTKFAISEVDKVVYLVTDTGIYRSGSNYDITSISDISVNNSGLPVDFIDAIDVDHEGRLVVLINSNIYISEDQGLSYQTYSTEGSDVFNPEVLLIDELGYIYISDAHITAKSNYTVQYPNNLGFTNVFKSDSDPIGFLRYIESRNEKNVLYYGSYTGAAIFYEDSGRIIKEDGPTSGILEVPNSFYNESIGNHRLYISKKSGTIYVTANVGMVDYVPPYAGLETNTSLKSYYKNRSLEIETAAEGVDSTIDGSYFLINSAENERKYYVWFSSGRSENVDPGQSIESLAGREGAEVKVLLGDDATSVASALTTTLSNLGDFDVSADGNIVSITWNKNGKVDATEDGQISTGFKFFTEYDVEIENTANSINGLYFLINSENTEYYVWFSTGSATDPLVSNRVGVKVDILSTDDTFQISEKLKLTIDSLQGISATNTNNIVTVKSTELGAYSSISLVNILYSTDEFVSDGNFKVYEIFYTNSSIGDGEDIDNQIVLLSSLSSASQSIDETARSIVRVINRDPLSPVYAFYDSGANDLPGIIRLENRSIEDKPFFVGTTEEITSRFDPVMPKSHSIQDISVGDSTQITSVVNHYLSTGDFVYIHSTNSIPSIQGKYKVTVTGPNTYTIPVQVTTLGNMGFWYKASIESDNDAAENRLYYSKTNLPEAVPLLNYIDIGPKDEPIQRIIALRDSLFVLKTDGVYVVSGTSAPNFSSRLLDNSVQIYAPDSAVTLANRIYALSTQGIVSISESGVSVISRPIENKILEVTRSGANYQGLSFGVASESDRAYHLWLPSSPTDDKATQCYRYNTFTRAWTRWTKSATCGVSNVSEDLLYLGSGDFNVVEVERKSGERYDHSDRSFNLEIGNGGVSGTRMEVSSSSDLDVGDAILQKVYVSIPRINMLLKTLDIDSGFSYSSFFADFEPSTGDDLRIILNDINAKLVELDTSNTITPQTFIGSFENVRDQYNLMIDQLNTGSCISVNKSYPKAIDVIPYEVIIESVNKQSNFIEVNYEFPFIQGEITVYKGYECEVVYAAQHFGKPETIKQVREATMMFDQSNFYKSYIAFSTDISPHFDEEGFPGRGRGDWGDLTFGDQSWGGFGDETPSRTLIPRDKQRCRYIRVRLRHINAREEWSVVGVSFEPRLTSSRGYK